MSSHHTTTTLQPQRRERARLSRLEIAAAYPTPSNRLFITQPQRTPPTPTAAASRRLTRHTPPTALRTPGMNPIPSLREIYRYAEESLPSIPGATDGDNSLNGLYQHPEINGKTSKPTVSAAKKFIDLLPTVPIASIAPENRECDICITPYHSGDEPEEAVKLPCTHIFGLGCITRWLSEGVEFTKQCPMCRTVLFVDDCVDEGEEVDEVADANVGRLALLRARDRMGRMLSQRTGLGGRRVASGRRR